MPRSHDQGFVGASPAQVYEVLANPSSYPTWWPGARGSAEEVILPLDRSAGSVEADGFREDVGLHLLSEKQELEWYLEPFDDGTIVNAFLEVPGSGRRVERRLLRMRSALRGGLVGLKRHLEEGG